MCVQPAESHVTTRLIDKLALFIGAPKDEPTLRGFGRIVGISRGGFRNWCRTAKLQPRSVRDFARGLRAIWRHEHDSSPEPADLLQIVDNRTLRKFCLKCGGTGDRLPVTVEEYLERQMLIQDRGFVAAVRTAVDSAKMEIETQRDNSPD